MKCPSCNEELGPPVGFDIYPTDDGVYEEDQYVCDQCRRYVTHSKVRDKDGYSEEVTAGTVMGKEGSCGMEDL